MDLMLPDNRLLDLAGKLITLATAWLAYRTAVSSKKNQNSDITSVENLSLQKKSTFSVRPANWMVTPAFQKNL
jgi:hypothetical protein